MSVTIALDAMGGDSAPAMVLDGAATVARRHSDVSFVLVGPEDVLRQELAKRSLPGAQFSIHHASQVVAMDEKPSIALRTKKDSSMRVGANLVKSGDVDALVSAGNTGALMATARFVLKTLQEIDRPAIASLLPSVRGQTLMLDLGANVDCTAEHLAQFALMGHVFSLAVLEVENPRIALLNIGEEEMKGNLVVKEAGELLKRSTLNYTGSAEGSDIFLGDPDVVVCDGFVGNVSLKTTEGVAQMMTQVLREAFSRSIFTKLGYLVARPALKSFRDRFDPRRYNGAMLLGLKGIVVKSHGSADGLAFSHAIETAINLVEKRVNELICQEVTMMRGIGDQT
ncbi:MAG: phosphate acyltransferase PlsX [Magnetococcales bacterium]|nr:phosphate acyltransferase PlsX [Magnetococcales bacterium]